MYAAAWYGPAWYAAAWWPAGAAAPAPAGRPWIAPDQLAAARRAALLSLPGTATILRRTRLSDGQGGEEWTWVDVGTAACRLGPARIEEAVRAGRPAEVTRWRLLLPWGMEVHAGDRVLLAGRVYEVQGADPPRPEAVLTTTDVVRIV